VWGHFNELLLKCPHHSLSQDDHVQAFYEGLNDINKGIVDLACGGMLMEKSSIESLSQHSQQFSSRGRQGVKSKGMYEVNTNNRVHNQMVAMERKLDMLVKALTTQNISPVKQAA
jgi:hypothetical protein